MLVCVSLAEELTMDEIERKQRAGARMVARLAEGTVSTDDVKASLGNTIGACRAAPVALVVQKASGT